MKRMLFSIFLIGLIGPTGACNKPTVDAFLVTVDDQGYHPDTLYAPPGKPTQITFKRTSEFGCGEHLVFPELKIKKAMPLNTPVLVDLTMPAKGSIAFTCGMAMYKGQIVAR